MDITIGTKVLIQGVKGGGTGEELNKVGVVESINDDGSFNVKVRDQVIEASSVSFVAAPEPKAEPKVEEPVTAAPEAPVEAPAQPEVPAAEVTPEPEVEPKAEEVVAAPVEKQPEAAEPAKLSRNQRRRAAAQQKK